MKLFLVAAMLLVSSAAFGMGEGPVPVQYGEPLPQHPPDTKAAVHSAIEDFEDGNFTKDPSWWTYGNVKLSIVDTKVKARGYALSVKGTASNWYVGGFGAYIADIKDASNATELIMDVYGTGARSGAIRIDLFDDDNGNWQIEVDPKTQEPLYDDRFSYDLAVDWSGWKRVAIPLSEFKDTNPGIGDDVWNPSRTGGSGGLIQMQFNIIAASKRGSVDFLIDNIDINGGTR